MKYLKSKILPCAALMLLLTISCNRPGKWLEQWRALPAMPGGVVIDFPLNNTLFPPEMAPATVHWRESTTAKQWLLIISKNGSVIHTALAQKTTWQPDSLLWLQMKKISLREPIAISVMGVDKNRLISGAQCTIRTSPDSVGAPIFYRAVPLPFIYAVQNLQKIRWHLGDIASPKKAPVMLENLPLCGNCHSFSADGKTMAMDVDYANDKGSYVTKDIAPETMLTPDDIITWSSFKPDDRQATFGLLSQISPDGRYVASTVKDRSIFVATEGLKYSQLFFPIKGIIVIYDREKDEFFPLPGADDPDYVQSNPTWSPDGQWLYFARTTAYRSQAVEQSKEVILPTELAQEFIDGKREFKFDIYRIPFNNGKGGKAEPLAGASQNGKSNFFPRLSPDGKWLVFTQAENFMLLQPDSRLYLVPPEGGQARLLACNSDSMNSWHAWSPNSRWLVFSSKIRGAYTDLLLSHIDDNGEASPPVLLENFAFDDYAVNIPEFVNLHGRPWQKVVDEFSQQAHYYFTQARSKMGKQEMQQAIIYFDKAIAIDPTYAKSYVYKGHIYFANEQYAEALSAYENAVSYISDDDRLYQNLGTTRYKLQKYVEAIQAFDKSIEMNPGSSDAYLGRALAFAKTDQLQKAMHDFDRALALAPNSAKIYHERGICQAILNQWGAAATDLQKAALLEPDNERTLEKLGDCFYHLQQFDRAEESYTHAINLNARNYKLFESRGDAKYKQKDLAGALADYETAITIQPRAGTSFYRRGVVNIQLGHKQAGCQDLVMAQQLGIREAAGMIAKNCR